jgi:DNA-binding CsgD family transcriptional regulator
MITNTNIDATITDVPGFFIWRKDLNSVYSSVSSEYANLMGFSKPEQMINLRDYDIPCKLAELANVFCKHDQFAIKTKSKIRLLEILSCKENVMKVLITIKSPSYDKKGDIDGTIGHTVDCTDLFLNMPSVISKIQHHNKHLFQNTYIISETSNNVILTHRQSECVFFLVRGKSGREIAEIMNLSVRTVEHYIETIKSKFNCTTKFELVDKLIEQGYLNVIPNSILSNQLSILI